MRSANSAKNWKLLSKGIYIEQYDVLIPWHITRDKLYQLIPEQQFQITEGGYWPALRFRFLGYSALWTFNFVSDDLCRFTELQFFNNKRSSVRRTYRRSSPLFQRALGRANNVDLARVGQQTWHKEEIWLRNEIGTTISLQTEERKYIHLLSVRCPAPK
jgi:hypothetical protein